MSDIECFLENNNWKELKLFLDNYCCISNVNGIGVNCSLKNTYNSHQANLSTNLYKWQEEHILRLFSAEYFKWIDKIEHYKKMIYDVQIITKNNIEQEFVCLENFEFCIIFKNVESCNVFKKYAKNNGINIFNHERNL